MQEHIWDAIWSSFTEHIGTLIFIILLGLFIFIADQIRNKIILKYIRNRNLHPLERSIRVGHEINNILLEIQIKTNADRAYLTQFHNGDIFSDNSPIWKCSRTMEICAPGISNEIQNSQNVLASLKTNVLLSMFHPEIVMPGVSSLKENDAIIAIYDVEAMDQSYWKSREQLVGCKFSVRCAMRDLNKHVVGYVGLDFNSDKNNNEEILNILPNKTSQISYLLTDINMKNRGFFTKLFSKSEE